jgi:hypothetical protein
VAGRGMPGATAVAVASCALGSVGSYGM